MATPLNAVPEILNASGYTDWQRLKQEYLNANLEAHIDRTVRPLNYKELAEKYGLNYGSVRAIASKEDWGGTLKKMKEEASHKVQVKSIRLTLQSEVEIRTRQATYARAVMDLAMAKLQTVDPQKLSVKEAAHLLQISAEMERRALGLEDKFNVPPPENPVSGQTQEAVRQALQSIANLKNRLRAVRQDDQPNVD